MFGTLLKMAARGGSGEDLFSSFKKMGIDVECGQIDGAAALRTELNDLGRGAMAPGARLLKLAGTMPNGDKVAALIVLVG